jgi:hypothetical protein
MQNARWHSPLGPLAGVFWVSALACLPVSGDDATMADEIAALVQQLGDDDYAVRETASARLTELGPAAADTLLETADVSDDLEVALRAKWLVDSLPLTAADDPPEVTAHLEPFATSPFTERVRIMHRLLRLDDDAGIEPLARIVRLERSQNGSRIAAALLAREWQAGDPYWPGIAPRIRAGLGPSRRPAAAFLKGLIAATTGSTADERSDGLEAARTAVGALGGLANAEREVVSEDDNEWTGVAQTGRIFRRCLAQLFVTVGLREKALLEASALFEAASRGGDDQGAQTVADLEWLATHGLPESVDLLEDRLTAGDVPPLLLYAAAAAWRVRTEPQAEKRAAALADEASRRLGDGDDFTTRLQAAMLLARWGADAWAEREYRSLLDNRDSPQGERALAAYYGSEFLHDRLRHAEAAAILERELEDRRKGNDVEGAFMQIGRDPRAVRSRMLYFLACAAAAAGDKVGQREKLEASLRAYAKDVDTLIAVYNLPDNTPKQKAEVTERVRRALAAIDEEIRALPEDPNSRNEYAWLVANTEGDLSKALDYSRGSLEKSFDSAGYLDTLAHCHAAAGNIERAIRTQWLAVRQEPHSKAIRRNLARFEARRSKP